MQYGYGIYYNERNIDFNFRNKCGLLVLTNINKKLKDEYEEYKNAVTILQILYTIISNKISELIKKHKQTNKDVATLRFSCLKETMSHMNNSLMLSIYLEMNWSLTKGYHEIKHFKFQSR